MTPDSTDPVHPAAAPRSPWLAAVLAVLVPGLGHVYAGRARRGAVAYLALVLAVVGFLALSMVAPAGWMRVGCLVLIVAAVAAVVVDAFRVARRTRETGFTPRPYHRWYVYLAFAVVMVFVAGPLLRAWVLRNVAEAYRIPTSSMEPTIRYGDYVLSAPLPPGDSLRRGMAVVYDGPRGGRYVSRVAGLPGDTLQMRAKRLYRNGARQEEPYALWIDPSADPAAEEMLWQAEHLVGSPEGYRPTRDNWGPLVVPPGTYFMLSDNRDNAQDSRFTGPIHRDRIIQRPVWIYFSRDGVMGDTRWERIGRAIR